MQTRLRLVIADDHYFFREGLKATLGLLDEVDLVAEAADGEELVHACIEWQPDIVFCDLAMPGMGGIEATKIILGVLPDTVIFALTMVEDPNKIQEMIRAGARGYLTKDATPAQVAEALKAARQQKKYYSESANIRLSEFIMQAQEKKEATIFLTEREKKIIGLVCRGKTNQQIASELHLSVKSIELSRGQLMKKLDCDHVSGIVVYAIRHGLFSLDKPGPI